LDAAFTTDEICGIAGVATFSVTLMVCGLLVALELLTLTVPV
jgi:predicted tellurium resistance membrane protein TerC